MIKNIFRAIWLSILIFVCEKIVYPILSVIDALYARRKYKKLIKQTGEMYVQYRYTKDLYFTEGGYSANKERIESRAKVLKNNAEVVGNAIKILNTEWAEFFSDGTRKKIEGELEVLKEIREFGEQNCQSEST